MSQTQSAQIGPAIRIAGLATACLFFLLISAIFGIPSIIVLLVVCIFTASIILPPLTRLIASRLGHLDPFSPSIIFPIAYMLWFVLGSINFIDLPSYLESSPFSPIPAWMYGLYACGLAGFFCGIVAGGRLAMRSDGVRSPKIDIVKMRRITNLVFIAALISWALTGLQFGIPLLHTGSANTDRLSLHGPIYQSFMYLSFTALMFAPIFTWARGGKQRYDWFSTIVIPSVMSLLLISLGGRSGVVCPLITVVIARSYFKKQQIWKLAVLGAVAFAIFSSIGYYREASSSDYAPVEGLVEYLGVPAPVVPVVYTTLYLRYTVAALRDLTQLVPAHRPFQHGAITLLPLTTFLPGHRDMSDVVFKNMLDRDFQGSGLPATILGPLYVDFGWVGVFFGMSLYGLLLSWTYRRMKSQPTVIRIITYAWWLQNTLIGIYCNGFISVLIFLIPIFWSVLYSLARPKPSGTQLALGTAVQT